MTIAFIENETFSWLFTNSGKFNEKFRHERGGQRWKPDEHIKYRSQIKHSLIRDFLKRQLKLIFFMTWASPMGKYEIISLIPSGCYL